MFLLYITHKIPYLGRCVVDIIWQLQVRVLKSFIKFLGIFFQVKIFAWKNIFLGGGFIFFAIQKCSRMCFSLSGLCIKKYTEGWSGQAGGGEDVRQRPYFGFGNIYFCHQLDCRSFKVQIVFANVFQIYLCLCKLEWKVLI